MTNEGKKENRISGRVKKVMEKKEKKEKKERKEKKEEKSLVASTPRSQFENVLIAKEIPESTPESVTPCARSR